MARAAVLALVLVSVVVGPAAAQDDVYGLPYPRTDLERGEYEVHRAVQAARWRIGRVQRGVATAMEVELDGGELLQAIALARPHAGLLRDAAQRAAAHDALNTALITAAFVSVRPVSTPEEEVPLVSFFRARDLFDLRHLPAEGRAVHDAYEAVIRALRPRRLEAATEAEARSIRDGIDDELFAAEAAIRDLLPVRALRPYARPLAQPLEALVRDLRARRVAFSSPVAGDVPLSCVGVVVDGAYVGVRSPWAGPAASPLDVKLGGPLRQGQPGLVSLDLSIGAARVGRFDVELVDGMGVRVALGRAAPEAGRRGTVRVDVPASAPATLRLVASALLQGGQVVVTTVDVEVQADQADEDLLDPAGLPPARSTGLSRRIERAIEREVAQPARRHADELRRAEADPAFARERAERSEVELRRELDRVEAELDGRAAPLRPRR